jgi:hypothetical protein
MPDLDSPHRAPPTTLPLLYSTCPSASMKQCVVKTPFEMGNESPL